jgi:hypothetical protein
MKNKFLLTIIPVLLFIFFLFTFTNPVFAQPIPSGGPTTAGTLPASISSGGDWQKNDEVTFAGKFVSRSSDVLNSVIRNYKWSYLKDGQNPFATVWIPIRNTIYAFLALFILAGAFLIIVTQGRSITLKAFFPRFALVLVLITLSYSIIVFLYDVTDIIQGFFLRPGGQFIQSRDLLTVAFDYKEFLGYRRVGGEYDESAFMGLLLTKLTAITNYAIFIILIFRKVVLWFFLVLSPVFPLLLLFPPIRNTAKIWIGEFFRWLLYAPLFSIFLAGLVVFWRMYIPFEFNNLPCGNIPPADQNIYPTSINIVLGGPCQKLDVDNNLNLPDSFIEYLIALLMLWVVIILPFILLKIFLDYLRDFNLSENTLVKYMINNRTPLLEKYGFHPNGPVPPRGPGPNPSSPAPAGTGREMPLNIFHGSALVEKLQEDISKAEKQLISNPMTIQNTAFSTSQLGQKASSSETSHLGRESVGSISNVENNYTFNQQFQNTQMTSAAMQPDSREILNLTNLSIPKMADIARYETSLHAAATDTHSREEANKITEVLRRISGTSQITAPAEAAKFSQIREKLVEKSHTGNPVAKAIVSATTNQAVPEVNSVQHVNLNEYEEVKKTWQENYRRMNVPASFRGAGGVPGAGPTPTGGEPTKEEWLKHEQDQITQVVNLISSPDPINQKKGMDMVSKILPFLLLGGFSRTEIIAYLKAKQQAAKEVSEEVNKTKAEEEDLVSVEKKADKKEEQHMAMEEEPELPKNIPLGTAEEKTPTPNIPAPPSPLDKDKF